MTAQTQSIKRKLSLLQLAEQLGNVSKACDIMGYHRDSFYEIRRAFQVGGTAALVESRRGPKNPHPNRVSAEVETAILVSAVMEKSPPVAIEFVPPDPIWRKGLWRRRRS
jgi:hypothetical protein